MYARECIICTCIWLHMIELTVTNTGWWMIVISNWLPPCFLCDSYFFFNFNFLYHLVSLLVILLLTYESFDFVDGKYIFEFRGNYFVAVTKDHHWMSPCNSNCVIRSHPNSHKYFFIEKTKYYLCS